jgi:hypothetical protein|tara:strand:+ start:630 stop:962 length:333 start_codon:yes stop_codon:yes gene_type:complete
MATRTEIKTKTFFQIPPPYEPKEDWTPDRVVFMDQGFDLNSIHHIGECVQVGELWYQFSIVLRNPERRIDFDFKRKNDCLMAQRELSRAWTRTGEFKYEDVPAGEGQDLQ